MEKVKSILSKLRIDEESIESTIRLVAPPKVRKSTATEFIRVHPTLSFTVMALTNVPGVGFLFIAPEAREGIENDLRPVRILPCMNREKEILFYPLVLTGKNGLTNSWSESAQRAMEKGKKSWIKIKPGNGEYECSIAKAELDEPDWSDLEKNVSELLDTALKPNFIEHSDHVVLKKLRGEL